jgi:zinc transport system substrate-binding protein
MNRIFYLVFLFIVACQPKLTKNKELVTVSILPQKYFVEQIAGDLLQINVLVPPGSSPHNYSVLPSQMKDLAQSKLWLQIGLLTFEDAWENKFAANNPNLKIVNSSEGVVPIGGSECADEGHQHADAADPHIWLAPAEVKIIAENSLKALKIAYPEHAVTFDQNYTSFVERIDSIAAWIKAQTEPLANRNILIFHPALAYYASEFQLEQIALELEGKEPSPKHMKEIVDLAKEKKIKVIFIQKEFDIENALQLSREIGAEVVTIDPLDYDWEKQMKDITEKIAAQK